METRGACVGVAEHGNSAVLVTLGPSKELLDRRRVDLTTGLPTHPYHHEGSWAVGRYLNSPWARPMALSDAVALVGFLAHLQVLIGTEHRCDRLDARERVGEGARVSLAQPLALRAALGDQLGEAVLGGLCWLGIVRGARHDAYVTGIQPLGRAGLHFSSQFVTFRPPRQSSAPPS